MAAYAQHSWLLTVTYFDHVAVIFRQGWKSQMLHRCMNIHNGIIFNIYKTITYTLVCQGKLNAQGD